MQPTNIRNENKMLFFLRFNLKLFNAYTDSFSILTDFVDKPAFFFKS